MEILSVSWSSVKFYSVCGNYNKLCYCNKNVLIFVCFYCIWNSKRLTDRFSMAWLPEKGEVEDSGLERRARLLCSWQGADFMRHHLLHSLLYVSSELDRSEGAGTRPWHSTIGCRYLEDDLNMSNDCPSCSEIFKLKIIIRLGSRSLVIFSP